MAVVAPTGVDLVTFRVRVRLCQGFLGTADIFDLP